MMLLGGIFVWLLGLCVGSFLNVVIYRLPRGLSVNEPRWSFCPTCQRTLSWRENLPLLSWMTQGARCRGCATPISVQYPLVEAATGATFVLVFVLLVPLVSRPGLSGFLFPTDAPLIAAWLILTAALLACSAMDVVSYMVDTRVTNFALLAGLICAAIWPRPEVIAPVAAGPVALGATVACLVCLAQMLLWRGEPGPAPVVDEALRSETVEPQTTTGERSGAVWGGFAAILLALLAFAALLTVSHGPEIAASWTPGALLAALFVVLVAAAARERPADAEIVDAIEEEARGARGVVLRELAWLSPAIVLGAAVSIVAAWLPAVGDFWQGAATWSPGWEIAPLGGLAWGLTGLAAGAGLGWAVRIVFTLIFGREAFGVGDIFILAAAGAAIGWDLTLLGFMMAVLVALLGWVLTLGLKRSVMIPFGPPLALGFLMALWFGKPAAGFARLYIDSIRVAWHDRPEVLAVGGGVLLIGGAFALLAARGLRTWLEPRDERVVGGDHAA